MKLFQEIRTYFEQNGFNPHRKGYNQCHVNGFLISSTAIVLSLVFLKNLAETVKEFTDSLYVVTAIVSMILCYANTIFKTTEIFAYFDQFDENVTTSKSIFDHSNPKILSAN